MLDKMKNHMVNGQYYFCPDEYLQVSQIRNLISRIKNSKNHLEKKRYHAMLADDGVEKYLEEICDDALNNVSSESDQEDIQNSKLD